MVLQGGEGPLGQGLASQLVGQAALGHAVAARHEQQLEHLLGLGAAEVPRAETAPARCHLDGAEQPGLHCRRLPSRTGRTHGPIITARPYRRPEGPPARQPRSRARAGGLQTQGSRPPSLSRRSRRHDPGPLHRCHAHSPGHVGLYPGPKTRDTRRGLEKSAWSGLAGGLCPGPQPRTPLERSARGFPKVAGRCRRTYGFNITRSLRGRALVDLGLRPAIMTRPRPRSTH